MTIYDTPRIFLLKGGYIMRWCSSNLLNAMDEKNIDNQIRDTLADLIDDAAKLKAKLEEGDKITNVEMLKSINKIYQYSSNLDVLSNARKKKTSVFDRFKELRNIEVDD